MAIGIKSNECCHGYCNLQNVAGAVVPLDTPAVAAARADHLSAKAAQTALVGPGLGYAAGIAYAAPAAIAAPALIGGAHPW